MIFMFRYFQIAMFSIIIVISMIIIVFCLLKSSFMAWIEKIYEDLFDVIVFKKPFILGCSL